VIDQQFGNDWISSLRNSLMCCGLLILIFSIFAQLPRGAAAACPAPPSGLVGWLPGDTNENEIVGGYNPSIVH
jgi:hypothetical protein